LNVAVPNVPWNMHWQTAQEAKIKDRSERNWDDTAKVSDLVG
jgi:hypothetical protein